MGYDLRGNLYEVFVETMATENDCRLNSMQAAGKNIEERCAELLFLYCRHWRNTVVVELLDMDSRLNRFGEENENMGKFDGKGLLRLMVHGVRVFMVIILVLPVPGCNRNERKAAGGPVEIVFKHGKIAGHPEPLKQLVARFEREKPDIRVREETLPASSDQQHQFYVINLEGKSDDSLAGAVVAIEPAGAYNWVELARDGDRFKGRAAHDAGLTVGETAYGSIRSRRFLVFDAESGKGV